MPARQYRPPPQPPLPTRRRRLPAAGASAAWAANNHLRAACRALHAFALLHFLQDACATQEDQQPGAIQCTLCTFRPPLCHQTPRPPRQSLMRQVLRRAYAG